MNIIYTYDRKSRTCLMGMVKFSPLKNEGTSDHNGIGYFDYHLQISPSKKRDKGWFCDSEEQL